MHQILFRLGLCKLSQTPLAGLKGPTLRGWRGGKEKEGERKGKEREGRGSGMGCKGKGRGGKWEGSRYDSS